LRKQKIGWKLWEEWIPFAIAIGRSTFENGLGIGSDVTARVQSIETSKECKK